MVSAKRAQHRRCSGCGRKRDVYRTGGAGALCAECRDLVLAPSTQYTPPPPRHHAPDPRPTTP